MKLTKDLIVCLFQYLKSVGFEFHLNSLSEIHVDVSV